MGALEEAQRLYNAQQMTHQPSYKLSSPVDLGVFGTHSLGIQTLPGQDKSAAQTSLDRTARVAQGLYDLKTAPAYFFPPAAVPASIWDATEGVVRNDPVQAATSVLGVPGRAAKLATGALATAVPTEAQAAPSYSGITGLYSRLADEVSKIQGKMPKASADNWLSWLNKNPNVPQAELKWGGLGQHLLDKGKQPVTAQEIAKYLEDNPIPMNQRTLGETRETRDADQKLMDLDAQFRRALNSSDQPGMPTAQELGREIRRQQRLAPREWPTLYKAYQLPGETDLYQEKVFSWNPFEEMYSVINKGDDAGEQVVRAGFPSEEAADRYITNSFNELGYDPGYAIERIVDIPTKYRAPHFGNATADNQNLAFHTRTNERQLPSGEKAYHIEEIQSDWAQKARDSGTYDPNNPYEVFDPRDPNTASYISRHPTLEEARQAAHELDETGTIANFHDASRGRVQGQPFAEEQGGIPLYAHTAFRKNLFDAAEADSDYLTWTTGKQQSDRYSGHAEEGMSNFYDSKMKKIAEREARRLGLDPKEVIVKVPYKEAGGFSDGTLDMADEYVIQDILEQNYTAMRGNLEGDTEALSELDRWYESIPKTDEGYRNAFRWIEEQTGGEIDTTLHPALQTLLSSGGDEVWAMKLSPEVRKKIREKGLPFMGVAATAGAANTGE
jgi:hypothetical protein